VGNQLEILQVTRHHLERVQFIPRPPEEVFSFFSRAENLERITPPELGFRIHARRPIQMGRGTLIDYTIRLSRVPLRWRTLIETWEPGKRFVDVQLRGPYRHWRHEHVFSAVPGGTEVRDHVEYELPFGPLGSAAHAVWVRRQLERIFDYRARAIEQLFAAESGRAA
jgi:ligand-binding SRPBCC domain-containing protein